MPYSVWPRVGRQDQPVRVRRRVPGRDRDLAARDGHGLQHQPGRGLPEPVADLIVEGDVLFLGGDVDVIAQAVEQLRAVGLRIDRLEVDPFDVDAPLGPVGLGIEVDALARFPAPGQPSQRTEIGQRVGIDVRSVR